MQASKPADTMKWTDDVALRCIAYVHESEPMRSMLRMAAHLCKVLVTEAGVKDGAFGGLGIEQEEHCAWQHAVDDDQLTPMLQEAPVLLHPAQFHKHTSASLVL